MTAALRFDRYGWAGGSEAMLRFGPDAGPVVVLALPLFEEANRTRAVAVAMLRTLAARGIGGALPDLPGQGESLMPTRDASLADWRAAFAAAVASVPRPVHVATIRGGALVDGDAMAASCWRLSPVGGAALARELRRVGSLAEQGGSALAGNDLSPDFIVELEAAEPALIAPLRTVRLTGDSRSADVVLDHAPPWRAAEPRRSDALAAALAADLTAWIMACAG